MSEHYLRLQQMLIDDGCTWDLSPNDKDAIRHILGMVNVMASLLADTLGTTVSQVLVLASKEVETGEQE